MSIQPSGPEIPHISVREVGLRDGLQSAKAILPTADKLAWIEGGRAAGVAEMEVTSFVPPKLLPQLADSAEVVSGALAVEGLTVSALVPNLRGAQDAVRCGVHKINCVIAASEGHNQSNLRRSTEAALTEIGRIVEFWRTLDPATRPRLCVGVATAFGCTIDGHVTEDEVRALVDRICDFGVSDIMLADTVGYGNPAAVSRLFRAVRADLGDTVGIAAHFHDTRGTGLANVLAALEAGVTAFDASLGGLGGCPYAPGATGNIVTEDLVYMLETMGLDTGVDLARLLELRERVVAKLPEERFTGALSRAGIPKNYRPAKGWNKMQEAV